MKIVPKPGQKLSVLVVDDEADIREALVTFLEMMEVFNFIVEAKDGQDAFLKYQNQSFDLIITDLVMPKASGIDLIKNIKKAEKKKEAKTLMMILSANLTSEEVKKAIAFGVKHALTKPCTAQDFMDKVTEVMAKQKRDKVKVLES